MKIVHLFSRVPILKQHSKPVTYFAVLKSMAWNTNNQERITFTIFGSKIRAALHAWLALDVHVYSLFQVPFSVCHCIYSLEQCPRRKSRVILEVKEVNLSTKKKEKLKTNSHTRKNHEKKLMLNFRIWNLAILILFPDEMVEWSQVVTVWK